MEYRDIMESFCFKSCKLSITSRRNAHLLRSQVGLPLIDHDKRYEIADEYLTVLYK